MTGKSSAPALIGAVPDEGGIRGKNNRMQVMARRRAGRNDNDGPETNATKAETLRSRWPAAQPPHAGSGNFGYLAE